VVADQLGTWPTAATAEDRNLTPTSLLLSKSFQRRTSSQDLETNVFLLHEVVIDLMLSQHSEAIGQLRDKHSFGRPTSRCLPLAQTSFQGKRGKGSSSR
jgi:hypothetical protein